MTTFLWSRTYLRPRVTYNSVASPYPLARYFHVSSRQQVWTEVISTSHSLIDGLHSFTGLPWVAVLPLTALVIRACITLPLTIYTRRSTQKQWEMTPLMTAWSHHLRKETMREKGYLGPAVVTRDAAKALRIKRRELYKRWSCSYWSNFVPSVSLLVWLPIMETLRNMSGAKPGILGLLTGKEVVNSEDVTTSGQDSFEPVAATLDILPRERNEFFEPTFATEGGLWFQDLTASDPLLLLPFMLSATILLNLMPSRRRAANVPGATVPAFQRRLTNTLRIMALAVGPLALNMPAGMLLYWTSSMSLGFVQSILLDKFMPLKPPVLPCRVRTPPIEKERQK